MLHIHENIVIVRDHFYSEPTLLTSRLTAKAHCNHAIANAATAEQAVAIMVLTATSAENIIETVGSSSGSKKVMKVMQSESLVCGGFMLNKTPDSLSFSLPFPTTQITYRIASGRGRRRRPYSSRQDSRAAPPPACSLPVQTHSQIQRHTQCADGYLTSTGDRRASDSGLRAHSFISAPRWAAPACQAAKPARCRRCFRSRTSFRVDEGFAGHTQPHH